MKSGRRWLQFSLKSLLLMLVLVSIGFGWWAKRSKDWIRQRHEALDRDEVRDVSDEQNRPLAPGGLWLFGEKGVSKIDVNPGWAKAPDDPELNRRAILFPEATVVPAALPTPMPDPNV